MPFDAVGFANDVINMGPAGDAYSGVSEGALDPRVVDVKPKLEIDFRDMGGLSHTADGAFLDAVQRGTDNMQGSMYATANAIGALTGFDALAEYGEAGFRDQMREAALNPARIESYEDVDSLAALGTYITEAVGENVMNMAMMATGGGLGVKMTQAAIGKAAIQRMSKEASAKLLKRGAVTGAAVPSYGMGAGEVQGEFIENGINAPGTALLAGIPIAGLDVFGLEKIIGVAFKGMPVTSAKELLVQAAKGFGMGAGAEMPTEAAQEFIGMVARASEDPSFELFTEENMKRLAEAGIKGGLAGGVMGGTGSTAVGVAKGLGQSAEDAKASLKARLGEGLDPEDRAPSAKAPDLGPTAPEPADTLQAGVDAIGRGGRTAAYSSDPKGFDNVKLPKGSVIVRAQDGGAYVTDQMNAHKVQTLDKAGKQAEILGYPNEKPAGEANPTVVQAKDAQGRTVQDVATDAAGLDTAVAQGQQAAGPGGTTKVTDAKGALNERVSNFDDDEGSLQGFQERNADGTARIDPEDLIGALTDEAMQQEPVTVTAKHSTTARLLNKIYGATAKVNTDGSRDITLSPQDPKATQGDPVSTHALVVKALAKVFDDGATEERGRIEVKNPFPTEKNKAAGKTTNTKVSLPAVIRLGQQINMLNENSTDRKANLMTGLAHLYELGFIPAKVRVQENGKFVDRPLNISNGKQTRLGLPLNTVIDGRETAGTAVTFGDVMGKKPEGPSTKQKLLDEYDKKSAQHKAMTSGTTQQKNKATLRHKQNATMLGKEVEALKARLQKEFGVEFKDGQGDSREIEQTQEARVIRAQSPVIRGVGKKADQAVRVAEKNRKKPGVKGEIDQIKSEHVEDTRHLPTDEDQAKASARDALPKKGRGVPRFSVLRNNKVSQFAEKLNPKLVDMAGKTLSLLGIKQQVNIVDEAGAVFLIDEMKATLAETQDAAERQVLETKIAVLEQMLTDSPLGRIIYNDEHALAADRVPTIFVSQNNTKLTKQIRVLTHELGHLVQRVAFDQAPKDVQEAIKRSMAGLKASSSNRFEENFANMLWRYMMELDAKASAEYGRISSRDAEIARSVLRSDETKKNEAERKQQLKDLQVVSQFFKKLAAKLRKLWQTMRGQYKLDEEYSQFVSAMVGVSLKNKGWKSAETRMGKKYQAVVEEMTMGPFMAYRPNTGPRGDNFTVDDVRAYASNVVRNRRAAKFIADGAVGGGKVALKVWNLAQDKVFRSADAYLRSLNSTAMYSMANEFHHQPGTRKATRAFFEETRYHMGQRQAQMDEILSALPMRKKSKGWWNRPGVDPESGEYVQLMQMLQDGVSRSEFARIGGVVGETGVKVRDYLDSMHTWVTGQGVHLKKRSNYFPAIADKAKWASAAGRAEVIAIFNRHSLPRDYAERVIDAVIGGDGYLADTYQDDDALLGPSFKFMQQRKLPPEVQAELNDAGMMVDDLGGILQFYTHSSIERGVTQRRWGLTPDEKMRLQAEMKTLGIEGHLNSPVAKLHLTLARALNDGEITLDQFRVVKNKVLEAYFGRLGANIDPRWQKFQGAMIIYQNIRLLSLSVLTAMVDAGQIVWRGGDLKTAYKGLKTFMDKQSREDLYRMAHLMGAVQDQLTEHVLNDQVSSQFMDNKYKQMNEKFFRMIGMHQWTNMTRVMGLSVGREFLAENARAARAGDAKAIANLEELGVTFAEVEQWEADGHPVNDLDATDPHSKVISALNDFIDEAVIRPDATTRPAWASDRNFQLLFHLKSFMWGYQEVILRRIWNQAKNEPTKMKALQQGGLSAAMLVAATLPLAIAGYEIRRLLSWWGNAPAQADLSGLDYFVEVGERAGYLGLFQFIADAEQAQDFGRLSILSAAGPTLSQLEEFIRDDWVSASSRAIPFLAQSGAARSIYRDILRGE